MAEEDIKKTAEAYDSVTEAAAKDAEKTSETMIEKEEKKEDVAEEKETREEKKDTPQRRRGEETIEEKLARWEPKTKLGKDVRSGKIKSLDGILKQNQRILEPEIVDSLGTFQSDLLSIGQSKGKFGGGKRRAWRQTQRKTKEGNVPTFSCLAVVGDQNGHVGIGTGKAMETLPARDKAIRQAKLNLIRVERGDGSFDSVGGGNTSIPFKVEGKAGSVRVTLLPAAPGTGLVVADEVKKILALAGIKDVYGRTTGRKRTTFNLIKATMDALEKTTMREDQ